MKHILIIEGFPPPHFWLFKKNYKLTWFNSVDRIRDRQGYFRKIGLPNSASIDEWVGMAKVINSLDPIDLVVNFREQEQDKTAIIAKELGLKWHSVDTIANTVNKFNMRKKLESYGLFDFKYKLVKSQNELIGLVNEWNIPTVLKPVASSGSTAINIIRSKAEAIEAWKNIKEGGFSEAILEEYIDGNEYSVEAFSQDGNHSIIAITQKFKNPVTCIEIGHSLPAKIEMDIEIQIEKYIKKVLDILDIKDGMTHTEIFLTPKGPFLVETHVRMGGFIPDLVKEALQIDMLDIWLNYIIEGKKYSKDELKIKNDKYAAIWFKMCDTQGVVKNIENIDDVSNFENVVKVDLMQKIGDEVTITKNSLTRLCSVIAIGDTPEEAQTNAKCAVEKIRYIIE